MLFSSITFLYYFLPAVLFLYFFLPSAHKNSVLFLVSLLFYGWGEPKYLIWMICAVVIVWICGMWIEKYKESLKGKIIFILSVAGSIFYLGIFKYTDFFIESCNSIFKCSLDVTGIVLPIGISFYTFQLLSYLIDVYRGTVRARKDFISFALYISMFPQLIAGPIVRYSVIEKQLDDRTHTIRNIGLGIPVFVIGLSKKVLLANPLGELCEIIKASPDLSVVSVWMYAAALSLQIYFDFSGYSDMAIGLGRMFGFSFPENFRYPFVSKSISEFWRRWHISLGTWFRDYVYIPLGGNRVSTGKFCLNIFIVWFLTGFWHGAGWNFIFWGLYYGVLLIAEKYILKKWLLKTRWLSHIYVLLLAGIGFIFFDNIEVSKAFFYIKAMFGAEKLPIISEEAIYYGKSYFIQLCFAAAAAMPYGRLIYEKIKGKYETYLLFESIKNSAIVFLLILCTAYLIDGSYNPFLYFRF